jgi:hypothetical protein
MTVWPLFLAGDSYRYLIVATNFVDIGGRYSSFVTPRTAVAYYAAVGISTAVMVALPALGVPQTDEARALYCLITTAATGLRGSAITRAQQESSPSARKTLGVASQIGGVCGSAAGLIAVLAM